MVSPVRVRVPPLLFSRHFQEKPLDLFAAMLVKCGIHHNCHHNGHSLKALREEVVEAHGCLAMHGGGDVGVGVGGLLHRSVASISETSFSCSLFSNMSVAKVCLRS